MSGKGLKGAQVTCPACEGKGEEIVVNGRMEAVKGACASCGGRGKIWVTRKPEEVGE